MFARGVEGGAGWCFCVHDMVQLTVRYIDVSHSTFEKRNVSGLTLHWPYVAPPHSPLPTASSVLERQPWCSSRCLPIHSAKSARWKRRASQCLSQCPPQRRPPAAAAAAAKTTFMIGETRGEEKDPVLSIFHAQEKESEACNAKY